MKKENQNVRRIGSMHAGGDIKNSENKNIVSINQNSNETEIGSMVAEQSIENSTNKNVISRKQIRTETVIISFIVGFLSSLLASYIFYTFFLAK